MSIMNQDKIAYTKSDFLILSHRNIIIVSKKHQIKLLFSNSVSKRSKSSGKASTRKMFYFPTSTPKPWVAGSNPPAPAKKSKPIGLDFFICADRHNIICVAHATSFEHQLNFIAALCGTNERG